MSEYLSHRTAIHRTSPSLPMKKLERMGLLKGDGLDFGCGKGFDAQHFGFDHYDPYFFPQEPVGPYTTITCTYVMNVIPKAEEALVLDKIKRLLLPDGVAYITVRRDLDHDEIVTSKRTLQRLVYLDLPVLYENNKYCIYEMRK